MVRFSWQNSITKTSKFRHVSIMMSLILLTLSMLIVLPGCGGGGGGSSTPATPADPVPADPVDPVDPYAGDASISGTVQISALSSRDTSELDSDTPAPFSGMSYGIRKKAVSAVNTATEVVKLYVMGADGELVDTEIVCTLTEDGDDRGYTCDGIQNGINYIVRYIRITGDGQALELKATVTVPAEGDAVGEAVSPATSVVTEALISAILTATADVDISDEVVNSIIEGVKDAIESLVESGAIQIPSMMIEITGSTLAAVVGEDTQNPDMENAAGQVLSDETVGDDLDFLASENSAGAFDINTVTTPEEKAALIHKVFDELLSEDDGEKDDMPEFFYNFFTWLYVNNETPAAGALLDTLLNSMEYSDKVTNGTTITEAGATPVIASFNTMMNNLHAILLKDLDTLTDEEKETLVDTPAIIRGLFPPGTADITTLTELHIPQGIALIVFMEEVYLDEVLAISSDTSTGTADESGKIEYEDDHYAEWSDEALFIFLGLPAYKLANPDEFVGIEIFGLYLHPGRVWIGNDTTGGTEYEALMGGTDFMNLAAIGTDEDDTISGDSGATVTLTYPKTDGTSGTIDFVYLTYGDGSNPDDGHWGLDPWMEAGMDGVIDSTRVVSDFTSGTYTVSIVLDGVTTSKSFEKKVITGMINAYPNITTPKGMPNWPGDNASQDEMDAFNNAWNAYYQGGGRTNFAANVMDDGSEPGDGVTATHAKITVSWEPPVVDLPDGVKMVYSLDVGQSGGCDDYGCSWEPIWNSWEENSRIYTTSFTIPHKFLKQSAQDSQNNPYHLNVGVYFVDKVTGEQLGSGGNAHTEFTVGEPIDLDATFTVRGQNAITISDDIVDPATLNLRVALIKETQDGSTFTKTIVKIDDIIGETGYALDFTISDFINDTTSANTWYNLILVEDDGQLADGDSLGGLDIMMYWPDFSSSNMWFDTWGGILRIGSDTCTPDGECLHEEIIITGDEIVDGPKFFVGEGNYVPPNPDDFTALDDAILAQTFTVTGNVDVGTLTNPKVVLIEEGYDDASGTHLQTVLSIGSITSGTYTIDATISDFYEAGLPTGNWYQIVLVDDVNQDPNNTDAHVELSVGAPLGWIPWWSPDWTNGGFGFDTWRQGEFIVFTDSKDGDVYTHTEIVNPSGDITGPDMAEIVYDGTTTTGPAP